MSAVNAIVGQLGGVPIPKEKAPFIHKHIERLSARAGIRKPGVYLIRDKSPNACAVGLSKDDAAVAVTTGLLTSLDETELESVLAHEIAHITKDHCVEKTRVAMKAISLMMGANAAGWGIATSDMDFTPGDDDPNDPASLALKFAAGMATAAAGGVLASYLMSKASIRDEFEADEFGGMLSKKPWALKRALAKLQALTDVGHRDMKPEVSQLFIVSPVHLNYETHPPIAERMMRLSQQDALVAEVASIETRYCSRCGEKTDADGKYCYWCGTDLEE